METAMNEPGTRPVSPLVGEIDLQEGIPQERSVVLTRLDGTLKTLEEIEEEVIKDRIVELRGQMSEVARSLRIGRSTLYRKLRSYSWGLQALNGSMN